MFPFVRRESPRHCARSHEAAGHTPYLVRALAGAERETNIQGGSGPLGLPPKLGMGLLGPHFLDRSGPFGLMGGPNPKNGLSIRACFSVCASLFCESKNIHV